MNSDTLAERFLEGLTEGGDAEVTHFYTNDLDVRPWQGCFPPYRVQSPSGAST